MSVSDTDVVVADDALGQSSIMVGIYETIRSGLCAVDFSVINS